MTKASIILDKSYLQGCKEENLKEITEKNRLLITADLFYEISSSPQLKSCFKKLLLFRDSIDLIEHLGVLYKFEIENQRPSTPLFNHFLKGKLNPHFNFIFDSQAQERINDFEQYHEKEKPIYFEKFALEISNILEKYKSIDFVDKNVILKIYSVLRQSDLPPADKLDENWALFRKLQIDLMAAKDYFFSFRNGKFDIRDRQKSHNQIDFNICIFSLLSGGLATEDKLLKRYFNFFCPQGFIYSLS